MNSYVFRRDQKHYTRVTKKIAAFRYYKGEEVWLCPCNIRPDGWGGCMCVSVNKDTSGDFLLLINEYECYNCTNSETGRYAAYYVEQ